MLIIVLPFEVFGDQVEKSTVICVPAHLFIWVEDLLLEAEALDLVEVLSGLERHHVVRGDASHRSVSGVRG
jgi:hypothetical protein